MRIELFSVDTGTKANLPYADGGVKAGFPSPAQDYVSETIDLNKELIDHPATTFYAKCVGDSMEDFGINDGDLLVIDKSLNPKDGDTVVAYIDGDFTLKKIKMDESGDSLWLMPGNPAYSPIHVTKENHFLVWGVVTYCIKKQA